MNSLVEQAVDDAEAITRKSRGSLVQASAQAARRASAVAVATSLLRAIAAANGPAAMLVPEGVQQHVMNAPPLAECKGNTLLLEKLTTWIIANPWELRKSTSVTAAILSASQLVRRPAADSSELEELVLAGLKDRISKSAKASLTHRRSSKGWAISFWGDADDEICAATLAALPAGVAGADAVSVARMGANVVLRITLPRAAIDADDEWTAMIAAGFAAAESVIVAKESTAITDRAEAAARAAEVAGLVWAARAQARAERADRASMRRAAAHERHTITAHEDDGDNIIATRQRRRSTRRRDGRHGLESSARSLTAPARCCTRIMRARDRSRQLDRARARLDKRWIERA